MSNFRAADFRSTSKSSVFWGPLQTLRVQGERSESTIYQKDDCAHSLRAVHPVAIAESSCSTPKSDKRCGHTYTYRHA